MPFQFRLTMHPFFNSTDIIRYPIQKNIHTNAKLFRLKQQIFHVFFSANKHRYFTSLLRLSGAAGK